MTNTNIMRLLGLTAILVIVPGLAYAAITNVTTVTVTAPVLTSNVNQVDVTWDAATINDPNVDGDLAGYFVDLRVTGSPDVISSVLLSNTTLAHSFTGLSQNTSYNATVIANFAIAGNQSGVFGTGSSNIDLAKPIISVTGINPLTIELENSNTYVDDGATVTDNDSNYVGVVITTNNTVNTSVRGDYGVLYNANADFNGNVPDQQTRIVHVVDTTIPVLARNQANPVSILKNHFVIPLNATVTDNDNTVNGDIVSCDTSAVNNAIVGAYIATCDFTDPSGNTALQVTYDVNVVSGAAPSITLNPPTPQSINLHNAYVEAGATALDAEDGNLTSSIITDSSAVDVDTLGSYIVTYDVTDSSGNTDHEERTVNVITGDAPVITILGDAITNIDYGVNYFDVGATASDTEDGDLTGSIITVNTVNTTIGGYSATTYTVTYDVTDSNGNTAHAERTVNVAGKVSHGDYCTGDCIPPTIGLDSSGRRMVDWPVIYHTSTVDFRQLAEYFHTPMNDFTVNVGDINTLMFTVYDNSGFDAIRQIGLSIGVPFSGTFNDGAAQLRWYAAPLGQTVGDNTSYIEETDKDNVFELKSFDTERVECDPHKTGNNNCMGVTVKYIFRESPKDTAVRLDIWDEKRNAFQHVLNEGVTVKGDSMNGPDVFTAMANDGRMYTLTTDNDFATDQNGDRWSLVDGFWAKDLKPVINMLDDAREMAKDKQESIAKQLFDGSKLQKTITPVKDFIPEHYDRLHDPVPNMIKAYIDYAKSKAGHS